MPDVHLSALPRVSLPPDTVRRARLACADAALKAWPEGDPRAVGELADLLDMLAIRGDQCRSETLSITYSR